MSCHGHQSHFSDSCQELLIGNQFETPVRRREAGLKGRWRPWPEVRSNRQGWNETVHGQGTIETSSPLQTKSYPTPLTPWQLLVMTASYLVS